MLGPIFSVEMVTAARRTRYFVIRVLYGLVLLIGLWLVYIEHFRYGDPADIGRVASFAGSFFTTFTVLQILAVFLLTPAMAAGTIALERERRTIEYLFVSHLTNVEIVFGKLGARLVQVICLILVGLPVLALAGLMGGIAPEALAVSFLMTLSTVVTVVVASIAISVWTARARDAVLRAYLVLFCAIVVPLVASAAMSRQGWWIYEEVLAPVNDQILAADPIWLLGNGILDDAASAEVSAAWESLLVLVRNQMLLAAACLAAATLAVRWVHVRSRSEGARRKRFRMAHLLRPRCGDRPMLWKEVFAEPGLGRLGIAGRIATLLIVLAVVGVEVYWFGLAVDQIGWSRWQREEFFQVTTMLGTLVACGGLLLVGARAAASVTTEKERECWDSLLSTPLAPREIVVAKVLGSVYAVRSVFFLLGVLWFLAVLIDPGFLAAVVFTLGTFTLLALAVSALGVLYSLWCRNSLRAMAATIATGLLVGGGYLFCCMFAFMSGPGPGREAEIIFAPCMPFLVAFPGVMYVEGQSLLRHDSVLLVAYVMGIMGYAMAGMLLLSGAIGSFDHLSGRTGAGVPYRPRPAWAPYVAAEVVVEETGEGAEKG